MSICNGCSGTIYNVARKVAITTADKKYKEASLVVVVVVESVLAEVVVVEVADLAEVAVEPDPSVEEAVVAVVARLPVVAVVAVVDDVEGVPVAVEPEVVAVFAQSMVNDTVVEPIS